MPNPNQVVGRARVKIDGQLYDTGKGNTTLEPGGPMREEVEGDYTAGSFRRSVKGSKLSFAALTNPAFSAVAFGAIEDATVSIEFDNGRSYVIRHAWAEGTPPMKTDGTADCVLMGPAAEEVR
ncbi:phage tail tube protein [Sphingomonas sp. AR_OL41]|uniref:phage tail tube protein n=1 Tax=Sphingomonas sp. AR_OL41 TaxID=3042729 RepID=UPI002480AF8D|nr:phage tail tube protein [Sphingomonas sp. AR_OL41]MDH7971785.1 phage tail tube protein [Sphingomonas sp. AR_OL41]